MAQKDTKQNKEQKTLHTVWRVPDALWAIVERILMVYDPPKKTGRPRINARKAPDGLLYRVRTGCQWNQLPAEFGDDASIHRTMQRWERLGIFDMLWAVLLTKCEEFDHELGDVDWRWQSADCCLGKARGVQKKGQDGRRGVHRPQPH